MATGPGRCQDSGLHRNTRPRKDDPGCPSPRGRAAQGAFWRGCTIISEYSRLVSRESGVEKIRPPTHYSRLTESTAPGAARAREPSRDFGQDQKPLSGFAEDVDE